MVPFFWDLSMSQSFGPDGTLLGPYTRDKLTAEYFPEEKVKGKRRKKVRRRLDYDLHLEITEMQLKCHVEARIGRRPYSKQLARERNHESDDLKHGEFRSTDLEKDLQLTGGRNVQVPSNDQVLPSPRESSETTSHDLGQQLVSDQELDNPPTHSPRDLQTLPNTTASLYSRQRKAFTTASGREYPAESSRRALSYSREPSEGTLFGEASQDQSQSKYIPCVRAQTSRTLEAVSDDLILQDETFI